MRTFLFEIEDIQVYEILQESLNSNELILFAGSGLSSQATTDKGLSPPQWAGLLKGMILWCVKERFISSEYGKHINELVENGFYFDAGQELQEIFKESTQLRHCLEEILLFNELKPGMAHSIIAKIPFRGYITTNYDDLIEREYSVQNRVTLNKFYERNLEGVLDAYRSKKKFILKLHGDISDPTTIVLGTRSYEKLLYFNKTYMSCLEHLVIGSSIIFIGFGVNDPDLEAVLSRVATFDGRMKRHWILLPSNKFPKLKARRLWEDKGISVIQYNIDEAHSGVVRFLENLASPSTLVKSSSKYVDKDEISEFQRTIDKI